MRIFPKFLKIFLRKIFLKLGNFYFFKIKISEQRSTTSRSLIFLKFLLCKNFFWEIFAAQKFHKKWLATALRAVGHFLLWLGKIFFENFSPKNVSNRRFAPATLFGWGSLGNSLREFQDAKHIRALRDKNF